jgi:hypothetical protein
MRPAASAFESASDCWPMAARRASSKAWRRRRVSAAAAAVGVVAGIGVATGVTVDDTFGAGRGSDEDDSAPVSRDATKTISPMPSAA